MIFLLVAYQNVDSVGVTSAKKWNNCEIQGVCWIHYCVLVSTYAILPRCIIELFDSIVRNINYNKLLQEAVRVACQSSTTILPPNLSWKASGTRWRSTSCFSIFPSTLLRLSAISELFGPRAQYPSRRFFLAKIDVSLPFAASQIIRMPQFCVSTISQTAVRALSTDGTTWYTNEFHRTLISM